MCVIVWRLRETDRREANRAKFVFLAAKKTLLITSRLHTLRVDGNGLVIMIIAVLGISDG